MPDPILNQAPLLPDAKRPSSHPIAKADGSAPITPEGEATVVPRFHHQWFPDALHVEKGFSPDTIRLLASRGHKLKKQSAM